MKVIKVALLISILVIAGLFVTNVFGATPTPTKPIIITTPKPTPTPTRRLFPTPTIMYRMNVKETNNTGKIVNDLEVYVKGKVEVLDWWRGGCQFQSLEYSYDPVTDTTTIRFYNGTVYPNDSVNTCVFLNQIIYEHYTRRWSIDGVPIDPVGATVSCIMQPVGNGLVDITIVNSALDGGPVTIGIVQIGSARRDFSFAELTWGNPILDQEIVWSFTLSNIRLEKNGSITIPSIPMPPTAVGMVYRLKVWLDSDPHNVMEYVAEFLPKGSTTTN